MKKTNQEILDQFGKIIVSDVYDSQYRFILNKLEDLQQTVEYKNLFNSMSDSAKSELELYTREILKGALFDFLKIFEENTEFKIVYTENKDLKLVSEMLKSEPIIENGWIDRFSEER